MVFARSLVNACRYVFTAGTEAYAAPLLDLIDPERKLTGRFYRTSCRRVVCELGELYLKDLSSLPLPQPLSRVVLVDNNPVSFLVQPCNGIPVVSWCVFLSLACPPSPFPPLFLARPRGARTPPPAVYRAANRIESVATS